MLHSSAAEPGRWRVEDGGRVHERIRGRLARAASATVIASLLVTLLPVVPHAARAAHESPIVLATIPVVGGPVFAAGANSVTNKVYVATRDAGMQGRLVVLDGFTNAVLYDPPALVGNNPSAIAVNETTNRIYVVNNTSGSISVVNGADDSITTIPDASVPGGNPIDVAVNETTNRFYVTHNNQVAVFNGATNALITDVSFLGLPGGTWGTFGVGVNPVTNRIYVSFHLDDAVKVLDGATHEILATIAVGDYPHDVAVNAATGRVYVLNNGASTVSVINGATNTVIATVAVGPNPQEIAVNETTNTVYVANGGANTATVIDGADNSVIATVNLGTGTWAQAVAVNETTDRAYVGMNGGSVKILGSGLPDLVVTALSGPATVQAGDTATYTWTIKNQGAATANAVTTEPPGPPFVWGDQVWLSTSPTSIAGAYAAGGRVAQRSLAPGESYTTTFSATVPDAPPGSYYLILETDSNGQIAEGNEANNLSVGIPVTVAATHRISGIVYDFGERPTAGVTVRIDRADGGAVAATGLTNAAGYYSLAVPDGATYNVLFLPPSGSGLAVTIYDGQRSTATATGVTVDGADRTNIDAFLERAYAVTGRVTDGSGVGRAGIEVWAYLHRLDGGDPVCCYFVRGAKTDANGQYSIELAPGAEYKLRFAPIQPDEQWWNGKQNPGNDAFTGWSAATPFGVVQTTSSCSGSQVTLFDNTNTGAVSNGGAQPSFTTSGAYCITYMQTYHWNNGLGAPPGTLGLAGEATLGPIAASGAGIQPSGQPRDWYIQPTGWIAPPGAYSCVDSDPATWAQNTGSAHKGFCIVAGVPHTTTTTYGRTGMDAVLGSDTVAPTWPAGSALTTDRLGPRLFAFSWPNATDDRGVAAYKVFQNGTLRATVGGVLTGYRAGALTPNTTYTFRVEACDAAGNCAANPSVTITTPIGLNNYTWSMAYELTPGTPVDEHLFLEGLSAWFKFTVRPDQEVTVTLTDLPADYDLLLFRDIAAANAPVTSLQDLRTQNAQTLDSALIDSSLIDSSLIDSSLIDSSLIDSSLIDSSLIDSSLIDSSLIDSALIDSSLIDSALIDSALIDSSLIDSSLIDSSLIDSALIDSSLIDSALIDSALIDSALIREASSSAARKSILARSAKPGTADERIRRVTFGATGDYYVRVRGRAGAFSLASPFTVQVDVVTGLCETIAPITASGPLLTGTAGGYKTLVLLDLARMAGTPSEKAALAAKIAAYVARPEVGGVLINVDQDARVSAANAQADGSPACAYAKNLAAAEIKRIVDSYRALNPVEDVVIVGPDSAIPFWREVSPSFGNETSYVPPVTHASPTDAALKNGLYLSQDRYGSTFVLQRLGYDLPVQDVGVSRVLETAAEAAAQFEAYLQLAAGLVPLNTTALVTGYEFLSDFAEAVRAEIQAGAGPNAVVDTLIGDTWTTNDLRAKILSQRYDLLSLGGHFTAFSTIGPDYDPATKLRSTEVLNSAVDMRNAIAASPGCHCGLNVPDADAIANVTPEPDWSQVAARKGFILVCGTGYQYGETELIEFSERLYLEFWKQLRTGTGAVLTSDALLAAKKAYLTKPLTADIHIKALLEVAHLGLPVRVNMPGERIPDTTDGSIVTGTTPYTSGPGAGLSLSSADTTLTFQLTENSVPVRLAGDTLDSTATYLSGTNGFLANPFEPVVPLELRNVVVPNTVLRGVGFRGGAYTDTSGVLNLVAMPGTELGADMIPVSSDVFYPIRFWGVNYLAGLDGGPVRLFVTPAQVRASAPGSETSIRRQFDDASFRLFYSSHSGAAATAGAHAIESVTDVLTGTTAAFGVIVAGDPRVGAQEVWITYTAMSGPLAGQWRSLDLSRVSVGPAPGREIWTGSLELPPGQSASDVVYMVQVANGLGQISLATNGGRYFRLVEPAAPATTTLALEAPAANTTGAFGESITVTARLVSGGAAVAGQLVTFHFGNERHGAVTDANGVATRSILLHQNPGEYRLEARFGGTDALARSDSGDVSVTVTKQGTALTVAPLSASGQYSDPAAPALIATLRDSSAAGLPLQEKTVYWVVRGADAGGTQRYFAAADITNHLGRAALAIESTPLPAGIYAVTAYFLGSVPQASGPAVEFSDELYLASSAAGTLTVSAEGATVAYTGPLTVATGAALPLSAAVTPDADGSAGDLALARVRYVVRSGATVLADVTASRGAGAWEATVPAGTLGSGTYTLEVSVVGGFYISPARAYAVGVGRIAFTSTRDGNSEIYVMNADGTGVTRLTTHPAVDADPAISPDGTKIAFTSTRGQTVGLYVMNADGTGVTLLTPQAGLEALGGWSPDGTKIVFTAKVSNNVDIYVMNADGTGIQRLTTHTAHDTDPSFSPNGQRIAFTSERYGNPEILTMRLDGTELTRLTTHAAFDHAGGWSPSGKIVFTSTRDGNAEIYVMNADGTGVTRLTSFRGIDGTPTWSRDGTKIAFTSTRDGNVEIYVMSADGTNVTRLTSTAWYVLDTLPSMW